MSFKQTRINPKSFHKSQIKFYLYLIPLAIIMVLPIIYIFSTAFKPIEELFAYPPRFFVTNPTLDNFKQLFTTASTTQIPISRYLLNSIFVTLIVLFLSVVFSSMAGYALSKHRFAGKKALFEVNSIALMFVATAVSIPKYLIISRLGLTNTIWAHILPILAIPVGLFLVKQFIDQVPDEIIEAARIDGANEFVIYWKIILPVIKPALATIAVLSFQAVWNNLETSQLYIDDDSLKTFAFFMSNLANTSGNTVAGSGMAAASSLIMFVPNLIVFIILQKNVMNTVAHSGLK